MQSSPERYLPASHTLVIFGATGDLTRRKLMPALFSLARQSLLPADFAIIAFARRHKTSHQFRIEMRQAVIESTFSPDIATLWKKFAQSIFYFKANLDNPEDYIRLLQYLDELDKKRNLTANRLFYLATPPSEFLTILELLGKAGLARQTDNSWSRVIIEKPFGRDLASAQALNRQAKTWFKEEQIYRIDHYLGKETVQNILVFRFANGIFEPLWNRRYVDHVQITVSESVGVAGRGAFYDQTGAIRDVLQNHMMQLLSLVAIEPPVSFDANSIRDAKVKVLRAIHPIKVAEVGQFTVRGQYRKTSVAGNAILGYLEEEGVSPESTTETFVALKLFIDNWRWSGVPFYLRSGKRLPKRVTEIAIAFKQAPLQFFSKNGEGALHPNVLCLNIQPDEGIALRFNSKVPGAAVKIQPVTMDFCYSTSFGATIADAYERLVLDCMLGDSTLFIRDDEVEAAWSFVTPIIEGWNAQGLNQLPQYAAGTWGPTEACEFIQRDGREWMRL